MIDFYLKYMLNEKDEPVPEQDPLVWGKWFEEANLNVASEKIKDKIVSTVFLVVDHNFAGSGEPILQKTAIFDKNGGSEIFRCGGLRKDALKMHEKAIWDLRKVDANDD